MAGDGFRVDPINCRLAANRLRELKVAPQDIEPRGDRKSRLLFQLALVAVCHQINWDFLAARLQDAFRAEKVDAKQLSKVEASRVARWLSDYHRVERIRAVERASLLRDVGVKLLNTFEGDASKLIPKVEVSLDGAKGLLARLNIFRAFHEDPLRKKSQVLSHELVRLNLIDVIDVESIRPAIDYHIIRLYLRSGRVVPLHPQTYASLQTDTNPRMRLLTLLRQSTAEALSLTAFYAGMSVPAVNGLEWQIGREVCHRHNAKCFHGNEDFAEKFASFQVACTYSAFCPAAQNEDLRTLREPTTNKSFY